MFAVYFYVKKKKVLLNDINNIIFFLKVKAVKVGRLCNGGLDNLVFLH
jgi:hypothetical protein